MSNNKRNKCRGFAFVCYNIKPHDAAVYSADQNTKHMLRLFQLFDSFSLQHREQHYNTKYSFQILRQCAVKWPPAQESGKTVQTRHKEARKENAKNPIATHYPKRDHRFSYSTAIAATSCCCFVNLGPLHSHHVYKTLAHLHAATIWNITAISEKITFFFF